jgi:hypothetical protein
MDALVVEAGTSDPRPDATGESASNPRPVREALGAIERAVSLIRNYWLLLAESHLTRRLFGAMLQRIWALPVPTG